MSTPAVSEMFSVERILVSKPFKHTLVPRVVAGVPLLGVGLVHVLSPEFGMRPLVEAAGLPWPALLSPVAVTFEIVAGVSLLLGYWARIGGLIALVTMLTAAFAHIVIDVWPNGPENEPPLALPLIVAACAAYVLWRGAGRWSLDARRQVSSNGE